MGNGFIPEMTPPGTAPIAPAKQVGSAGKGKGLTTVLGAASSAAPMHGSGVKATSGNTGHKPLQTRKAHAVGLSGKKPLQNSAKGFRGRR